MPACQLGANWRTRVPEQGCLASPPAEMDLKRTLSESQTRVVRFLPFAAIPARSGRWSALALLVRNHVVPQHGERGGARGQVSGLAEVEGRGQQMG